MNYFRLSHSNIDSMKLTKERIPKFSLQSICYIVTYFILSTSDKTSINTSMSKVDIDKMKRVY